MQIATCLYHDGFCYLNAAKATSGSPRAVIGTSLGNLQHQSNGATLEVKKEMDWLLSAALRCLIQLHVCQ